jgi:phosphonate transport system permease protein
MLGLNSDLTPAYWQLSRWLATGKLAYQTLAMSVLAIGIAGIGAFLTLLLAARNTSNGNLGGAPSRVGAIAYYLTRASYTFSRGVPELVWAMIIVFFLSPGILPGALALGFHNYGIVGRLTAEVVENLDPAPARALRAAGAGNTKMLLYGILPQALPQFITYLLYRWEVVIRTTVVVGFVSAGGLGREFILRLSWFHYTDVSLIIIWYLALVIGVDLLSAWLRRLARF